MQDHIVNEDGLILPVLDSDARAELLAMSRPRSFARGTTIFAAGEPGSLMFLIESGRVEVSITALSGRRSVLNHMGPGEVLGDLATLDGGPRSADAVAASDVTGRMLTRQNVLAFLADHPDLAFGLIIELCRKLRNVSDLYAAQALTEGGPRLARALLKLFDKWGEAAESGQRLTQTLSQAEIGEFAGLARENVNRYLRAWAKEGLVTHDGRVLVLHDRAELERRADL